MVPLPVRAVLGGRRRQPISLPSIPFLFVLGYWVIGYTCFVLGFVCRVFKQTSEVSAYLSCSRYNMDLFFYQIGLSSVYQSYLVTTQLIISKALRKNIPQNVL
jgi:hypothetical protein